MKDIILTTFGVALGMSFIFGLPWLLAALCVMAGHGPNVCGI